MAEGIAFVKGAHGYSLVGSSKKDDFEKFQPLVESMIDSLQFIAQKEADALKPPRLRIHKVESGETWVIITKKYFGSSQGMGKLAEYNGLEVSQDPNPGMILKIPPSLRF